MVFCTVSISPQMIEHVRSSNTSCTGPQRGACGVEGSVRLQPQLCGPRHTWCDIGQHILQAGPVGSDSHIPLALRERGNILVFLRPLFVFYGTWEAQ